MSSALTQINFGGNMRHLALHISLIGALGILTLAVHYLFFIPLGLCLGALFPLMHEATHRHIFVRPKANHRLAFCCGAVLLMSATWFRHFHQAHHRYTQDPKRDPELAIPKPSSIRAYLWYLSGLPTWTSSLSTLIRYAFGKGNDVFLPQRKQPQVKAEARALMVLHAGLLIWVVWQPALILLTYAPLVVGQIFLRAFLLAEHGGLPLVSGVMDNTRTTHTVAWLRWLTWNMSFHKEHHASPAVPYDKLPVIHEILKSEACPSYTTFHKAYISELKHQRTS